MGMVLQFKPLARAAIIAASPGARADCQIIIFPGVRIERHDLDLSHRLRDSVGRYDYDGIGSGRFPRRTS